MQLCSANNTDWANGLAIMVDGVQYVFVYVEQYTHDQCENQYSIELKSVFYDVFGLDDTDVTL